MKGGRQQAEKPALVSNPQYICEAEVERVLQAGPLTDALEQAFRHLAEGQAAQRLRDRVVLGKHVQHTLAAISQAAGVSAVKTYLSGPSGVQFVTLLFSLAENRLLATIESARLGQLRTGCATALAVRHLAAGSQRLALFGTGTVAQGQLEALQAELGPRLESIQVYSRKEERRQCFVRSMTELLGRPVGEGASPQACLEGANLVVTATTSSQPLFASSDLGPTGVLCAVGGNWARKREIDAATVELCRDVWVDDLAQARLEAGELLQLESPRWDEYRSLAQLVTGGKVAQTGEGWSLFKSLGVGLEDLAAAHMVYEAAKPTTTANIVA